VKAYVVLRKGYEASDALKKELRFLEAGGTYNDGAGPIDSGATSGAAAAARR
jgi:hypothetical protein